MEPNKKIEDLRHQFSHIPGWGVDADPHNEPTYPMKHYTGDDHKRLDWERPPQQESDVEILHSTEQVRTPAVFGTTAPPSGLSGAIRRFGFKYSENMLRHWLLLIAADRVDVVEGLLADLASGTMPKWTKERGFGALWAHNKPLLLKRAAIRGAFYGAVIALVAVALWPDSDGDKAGKARTQGA